MKQTKGHEKLPLARRTKSCLFIRLPSNTTPKEFEFAQFSKRIMNQNAVIYCAGKLFYVYQKDKKTISIKENSNNVVKQQKIDSLKTYGLSLRDNACVTIEGERFEMVEFVAGLTQLNCTLILNAFRTFTAEANKLPFPRTKPKSTKKDPAFGAELLNYVLGIVSDATVIFETLEASYRDNNGEGRSLNFSEMRTLGNRSVSAGSQCKAVDSEAYVPNVSCAMECQLATLFGIVLGEIYKDDALSQNLIDLNDPDTDLAKNYQSTLRFMSFMSGINLKKLLDVNQLKETLKIRVETFIQQCGNQEALALRAYIEARDPSGVFIKKAEVLAFEEQEEESVTEEPVALVTETRIVEEHFGQSSELRRMLHQRRAYFTALECSSKSYIELPSHENEMIVQGLIDEILSERISGGNYQFFSPNVQFQDPELGALMKQFQTHFHGIKESIQQMLVEEQTNLNGSSFVTP